MNPNKAYNKNMKAGDSALRNTNNYQNSRTPGLNAMTPNAKLGIPNVQSQTQNNIQPNVQPHASIPPQSQNLQIHSIRMPSIPFPQNLVHANRPHRTYANRSPNSREFYPIDVPPYMVPEQASFPQFYQFPNPPMHAPVYHTVFINSQGPRSQIPAPQTSRPGIQINTQPTSMPSAMPNESVIQNQVMLENVAVKVGPSQHPQPTIGQPHPQSTGIVQHNQPLIAQQPANKTKPRKTAVISDPDTGKVFELEELAKSSIPSSSTRKNQFQGAKPATTDQTQATPPPPQQQPTANKASEEQQIKKDEQSIAVKSTAPSVVSDKNSNDDLIKDASISKPISRATDEIVHPKPIADQSKMSEKKTCQGGPIESLRPEATESIVVKQAPQSIVKQERLSPNENTQASSQVDSNQKTTSKAVVSNAVTDAQVKNLQSRVENIKLNDPVEQTPQQPREPSTVASSENKKQEGQPPKPQPQSASVSTSSEPSVDKRIESNDKVLPADRSVDKPTLTKSVVDQSSKTSDSSSIKQLTQPTKPIDASNGSLDKQPSQKPQPAAVATTTTTTSSTGSNASTIESIRRPQLDSSHSKSDSSNKVYDTDYMKSLQFKNLSVQRPQFNAQFDIILKKLRSESDMSSLEPNFMKNYANRSSMLGRGSCSMQGPRPDRRSKIIISNSLNQDVQLRTSEHAWKPKKLDSESCEALIKQARGLLNKLTPQNFGRVSQQLYELRIDTEEKLRKIIDLIFDKAVDEVAFCDQYAELCQKMSSIHVINEDGKPTRFNTLLLQRCQTCFEGDKYSGLNLQEREEEIEQCTDKEKQQQLINELDEEKRLVRNKSLGNIKLIGALFKIQSLKNTIMDSCIDKLLENDDEDSYECLCSLLKSIGEKFERSSSNKTRFIQQMKSLENVISTKNIASRIKFMIMDIIDMRKNGWKVRKLQDVNKPKTIEEVHEDLKKEEEMSIREMSLMSNRRNEPPRKRSDNWIHSANRKSQQNSEHLLNLRKIAESRSALETNQSPNTSLIPGSLCNWSRGASAKTPLSNSSDKKQLTNQTPLRSDSRSNDIKLSSQSSPFRGTYSAGNDKKDLDLMKQHRVLIKKYVEEQEMDILIKAIYDACTEESVYFFVVVAIESACENLKEIDRIGELLADLVFVKKVISDSQFHKGLKHHLDDAEDLITDIPKFYAYIGQILSHFIFKVPDNKRATFYRDALVPCPKSDHKLEILAHLLEHVKRDFAESEFWQFSEKWDPVIICFVELSKDLKIDQKEGEKDNSRMCDKFWSELSKLQSVVNQILTKPFSEVPKICKNNWCSNVENNKNLISALIERCLKDTTDRNTDKFVFDRRKFESMVSAALPVECLSSIELELAIIYASVKVNSSFDNPKDFLINVFSSVYDTNLVRKETFLRWRSDNKKDVAGNLIAIITVKRFFSHLIPEENVPLQLAN